jgi:uncharacterized protein (TIGR03492 family)
MLRALFISNGHGETAIAARIARDLAQAAHTTVGLDLFAAVGTGASAQPLALVGPRRTMPSGGLVAMGNVRAFARDLGAGFASLFGEQLAFLQSVHGRYDVAVAVGDAYALGLAFVTGLPAIFVGTAKSVYVAPYGPFERTLLKKAIRIFVRDEPTAARLRAQGVAAEAPGNVIVDLAELQPGAPPGTWLGLLPGSREDAYAQGVRLARVVRTLGGNPRLAGGLLSIAPTLSVARFANELAEDGWQIDAAVAEDAGGAQPFRAHAGDATLVAWRGELGALLGGSAIVLGQAGTANEQAAARGIPVVALDDGASGKWYRMRQRRLLGEALAFVPVDPVAAALAIDALLDDAARLHEMSEAGRARMGPPGGAAAIARAILAFAAP